MSRVRPTRREAAACPCWRRWRTAGASIREAGSNKVWFELVLELATVRKGTLAGVG